MTGRSHLEDTGFAACPADGKVRYLTRKGAKKAAKGKGGSGREQMPRFRVYQCGEYWHVASWYPAQRVAFYRALDAGDAGDSA